MVEALFMTQQISFNETITSKILIIPKKFPPLLTILRFTYHSSLTLARDRKDSSSQRSTTFNFIVIRFLKWSVAVLHLLYLLEHSVMKSTTSFATSEFFYLHQHPILYISRRGVKSTALLNKLSWSSADLLLESQKPSISPFGRAHSVRLTYTEPIAIINPKRKRKLPLANPLFIWDELGFLLPSSSLFYLLKRPNNTRWITV